MSDPIAFLNAFAHALATMSLYTEGHPARARAVDAAYRELADLQATTAAPQFTFLGEETVYGKQPLRDLKAWDWGRRLALAGVQRLEFEADVGREDFDEFLSEVLARLTLSTIESSEARQMRRTGIRFGEVGLRGEREAAVSQLPTATIAYTLEDEAETLQWLLDEVRDRGTVPLVEAEAVVRSLTVAMHGEGDVVLPLLQLKEFDQYTTTHSLNVAVLAMGLAEYQGLPSRDVRAFGISGLLHDIGKIRIPIEVLTKPGKFTDEERALMNQHPADGARIILETEGSLDLPSVVAYEHHILLDGSGYPSLHYRRDCHPASKLVHICDVYDALRTRRPYREAWDQPRVLAYLEGRAGVEFDPALVTTFVRMIRQWETQVTTLPEPAPPPPPPPHPPHPSPPPAA